MAGLLRAQNIVDIENVVALFVVITIVLYALAWFGQHAARIPRRLVLEGWIADAVRGR